MKVRTLPPPAATPLGQYDVTVQCESRAAAAATCGGTCSSDDVTAIAG